MARTLHVLPRPERYLLNVMRYIDLDPVRTALVETPEDYRCRASIRIWLEPAIP